MNTFLKPVLAASIAAAAFTTPATAQVNGIATVDLPIIIAQSQAFQTGYQQVATAFQAQRTTIEQRQQQRQTLIQQFDTNSDGQLDQTEMAVTQDPNNATVRQVQAIDTEVQQLQQPINLARVYVVQQIAQQYAAALQQVVSERSIQVVLSPDALVYAQDGVDVSEAVVAALNTRVPSVTATPPADWQPSEAAVNLFQQIQQVLLMAAQQQAAAQQPAAPAAAGR